MYYDNPTSPNPWRFVEDAVNSITIYDANDDLVFILTTGKDELTDLDRANAAAIVRCVSIE